MNIVCSSERAVGALEGNTSNHSFGVRWTHGAAIPDDSGITSKHTAPVAQCRVQ